jgi:hypothetical protein
MQKARCACGTVISLLLVSGSVFAQGTNSGLVGLREAYFMIWGGLGLVPALMLLGAFAVSLKDGRRKPLAVLLTLPAILYVPTAIFVMIYPSTDLASKFPGTVGFGLLIALLAFRYPEPWQRKRTLQGITATIFVVLLLIPNSFWETPLFSFEKKTFVNNLADLNAISTLNDTSMPYYWLPLQDGRYLFQVPDKPQPRAARNRTNRKRLPSGDFVVLEERATKRNNSQFFDVTFYGKTYEYATTFWPKQPRIVIPLNRSEFDMYKVGGQSQAILLDKNSEVDFEVELLRAIERFNTWNRPPDPQSESVPVWQKFVLKFIELGDIDFNSQAFVNRAFSVFYKEDVSRIAVLFEMGMDAATVDRYGRSALHIAASHNHLGMARRLMTYDIDPDLRDGNGDTALEIIEERYKDHDRERTPIPRWEELLEGARQQ